MGPLLGALAGRRFGYGLHRGSWAFRKRMRTRKAKSEPSMEDLQERSQLQIQLEEQCGNGADCERQGCAAHEAVAHVRSQKVPLRVPLAQGGADGRYVLELLQVVDVEVHALYMGELLRLSVIQMAKVLNFGPNILCAEVLDL